MRQLSKSKLIAFRQCPRRLWLEIHRSDLRDDSGSEMVFQIGNEVGEMARRLYDEEGTGTFVDINELGYEEAFRLSEELLWSARAPVFEAGLRIRGALAFADVMLPVDDTAERRDSAITKSFVPGWPWVKNTTERRWRMVEVKSSTGVKDYHLDDLAIQAYVATAAGLKLDSVALAHIDNSFVYAGDGDYRGLFAEVDLTREIEDRLYEIEEWIEDAQATAALTEEPEITMGPQCSVPFDCPFAAHCGRDQVEAEYPLTSLPRLQEGRRTFLASEGFTDLREVPDEYLTETQQRVKAVTLSGETSFDAAGAAADLAPHGFPAWFLDFETVMLALPIWKGTRPYQKIPFQYSIHRIDEEGALSHDEFLDLSGNDPSESLARDLVGKCGDLGPVYAYNAGFERGVIRDLANRFPEQAGSLLKISDRLVDLLPIARERFYHPSQHGSWGLKSVLPAICPELSYESLNGVSDGGMAMDAFREAIADGTTNERKREIERELREYCELDTLAMVRVWEVFGGRGTSGISLKSVASVCGRQ